MIRRFSSYIFTFILLAYLACDTRNNIIPRFDKTFIKIYGGEYVDKAADFIALDTGGFVILGSTRTTPSGTPGSTWDMLYIITDKFGNIYKQKVLGDSLTDDEPLRILQVDDGFIICGNSITLTGKIGFLLKINPVGDTIRFSTFEPDFGPSYEFNDITSGIQSHSIGVTGIYHQGGIDKIIQTLISTDDLSLIQSKDGTNGKGFGISSYKGIPNPDPPHAIVNLYRLLVFNYTTNPGTSFIVSELQNTDNYVNQIVNIDVYPVKFISDSIPDSLNKVSYRYTNYILGYLDPDQGKIPYLAKATVTEPNTTDLNMTMTINSQKNMDEVNYRDIIPSDIKFTNDWDLLMIGTEAQVSGNKKIRLLKINSEDFTIQKDKSFGTGDKGDQAFKLEVLPDGSVVFLATVDYQLGKTNTKIALYKLTPDLELDF